MWTTALAAIALLPLSLFFAGTGSDADRGGLTPPIAVGGGAEVDDGGTGIDRRQTMMLLS